MSELKSLFAKSISDSPLGKANQYIEYYDPKLLFPISRAINRSELNIQEPLPFNGIDVWNAYELSWLNSRGKPVINKAKIYVPCTSSYLIESKSLKLYLNSFNQTKFSSTEEVQQTIKQDLRNALGAEIKIELFPKNSAFGLSSESNYSIPQFFCLDNQDISCDTYHIETGFLSTEPTYCQEKIFSHLLKSNCPITGQPDWATLYIHYSGQKINPAELLRYIVSLRQHTEFHENCIERIFRDISLHCKPDKLTVFACYTRRGGIDINPFRSNFEEFCEYAEIP